MKRRKPFYLKIYEDIRKNIKLNQNVTKRFVYNTVTDACLKCTATGYFFTPNSNEKNFYFLKIFFEGNTYEFALYLKRNQSDLVTTLAMFHLIPKDNNITEFTPVGRAYSKETDTKQFMKTVKSDLFAETLSQCYNSLLTTDPHQSLIFKKHCHNQSTAN